MELKVYNWEYFERWKVWYIVFSLVILLVIVISVLSKNIVWWVLVLLFAGGYIYYLTKINDTVVMKIWANAFQIDKVAFPWNSLSWFVLEYHTQKQQIHNIVIIDNKNVARIYTINDTDENLENFVNQLSEFLPILDRYEQTNFEKFIRKIKL